MATEEQLQILKQGVEVWNKWRLDNPLLSIDLNGADLTDFVLDDANLNSVDLSNADLHGKAIYNAAFENSKLCGANLSWCNLFRCSFQRTDLKKANLTYTASIESLFLSADLSDAKLPNGNFSLSNFFRANLCGADLRHATLGMSNFTEANLNNTDLSHANLTGAICFRTDFSYSNLTNATLYAANFVEVNLEQATLASCSIHGISAWNLKGTPKVQSDLVVTNLGEDKITVDDLLLAQFIYLLLDNKNIRNIFDTVTSKAVLILGRFSEERKSILEAVKENLRSMNFTPIIFDVDKPASKDLTGTLETLARMARFIIADLTDPSSIPHELATLVPFLRTTPVLSIKLKNSSGYSMFADYQRSYPWVLKTHEYVDNMSLIAELSEVIVPANEMAEAFRDRLEI